MKEFQIRNFFFKVIPPLGAFIVFLLVWQFGVSLLGIAPYLLPKPTDVLLAISENSISLLQSTWTTTYESLLGFGLSVFFGVGGAILLASSKVVERSVYPYAIILQTIPIVAIAPIIVIWLGAGPKSVVTIAFIISFFPMLSNTLIGLNSTDKNLKNLFYLYNANRWQTMFKLRIPAALPYIVAGLKISCTLSVIGAIIGEYIAGMGGSQGGLGFAITSAALMIKTPYLFACGVAASILGITFYLLVSQLGKYLLSSWHESEMRED